MFFLTAKLNKAWNQRNSPFISICQSPNTHCGGSRLSLMCPAQALDKKIAATTSSFSVHILVILDIKTQIHIFWLVCFSHRNDFLRYIICTYIIYTQYIHVCCLPQIHNMYIHIIQTCMYTFTQCPHKSRITYIQSVMLLCFR